MYQYAKINFKFLHRSVSKGSLKCFLLKFPIIITFPVHSYYVSGFAMFKIINQFFKKLHSKGNLQNVLKSYNSLQESNANPKQRETRVLIHALGRSANSFCLR